MDTHIQNSYPGGEAEEVSSNITFHAVFYFVIVFY